MPDSNAHYPEKDFMQKTVGPTQEPKSRLQRLTSSYEATICVLAFNNAQITTTIKVAKENSKVMNAAILK